jgi:hypothetical protein
MTDTIANSIKRIVKSAFDSINNTLPEKPPAPSIDGKRGIAFQGDGGNVSTGTGTKVPGNDIKDPSDNGNGGPTVTAIGNFNSASPNSADTKDSIEASNPAFKPPTNVGSNGSSDPVINTSNQGVYPLKNIIDNLSDKVLVQPLGNSGPGTATGTSNWGINGVNTWNDCNDTSKNGSVRFDDFLPPISWRSANYFGGNEDGTAADWTQGYYWVNNVPGDSTTQYSDPQSAAQGGLPTYNASGIDPTHYYEGPSYTLSDPDNGVVAADQYSYSSGALTLPQTNIFGVFRVACGGSTSDACLLQSAPKTTNPTNWPPDGIFQILSGGGNYMKSPFEPPQDLPGNIFDHGTSTLNMCFDGGRKATMTAGINGTKLLYEVNPTTGVALSPGYLHIYSADGIVLAVTDISDLNTYLPATNNPL